ncbi:MAG: molybdopterin molybdotransferase MoeA [Bacteroidetes bacterium]|nr:MAG: molybdopterin molybdotransferase MoeA [Bacteroidota bacterium]
MISFAEACEIVRKECSSMPDRFISVPLTQAIGHILAEDVVTDTPLPPFTNSAVDGVAVRYSEGRREWTVAAEITAGHFRQILLREDEGASIMTGARLPEDADTVIPVEDLIPEGDHIRFRDGARLKKGMNIRRCGEDMEVHVTAVTKGTPITPSVIPLLAACGKETVNVRAPLTAAIVTTGDELVPHSTVPAADQIRATNRPMLLTAVFRTGITVKDFGIINDDPGNVSAALRQLMEDESVDLIITTGGVSVGTRDLLRSELHTLGAEELFWRVRMKPGTPVMFSRWNPGGRSKYIMSLPGNPLSAFVTWTTLFAPSLAPAPPRRHYAHLNSSYSKKDDKRHILCGQWQSSSASGLPAVIVSGSQSSGGMTALARAHCLIIVPEETAELRQGDIVECIPL